MNYEILEQAIYEAGQYMLSAHLDAEKIHDKQGAANFVTDYDVTIQRRLMNVIRTICPDAVFYGEEDADGNAQCVAEKGYTFFIDPIDGTTNFMFDYHHSCVSVGVAKDKTLEAGFVYNPYVDEMYMAFRSQGAYLKKHGAKRKLVTDNKPISQGIVSFGCARYNERNVDLMFELVQKLFLNSLSIRNGGSAALDLSRIASGNNVIYVELKLQPYDYAAAALIIEEAGGVITQMDGTAITLEQPCSILAGTKAAHKETQSIYEEIRKK